MAAPPVCPASCGLRLGAAVPFWPRSRLCLSPPPRPGPPPRCPPPLLVLPQPFLLVAGPIRHLVAALVLAESLVLFAIRRLGGRPQASDLGFQFRLAFLHAFITHCFVF